MSVVFFGSLGGCILRYNDVIAKVGKEGLETMFDNFGTFLFGWPLMIVALLLSALGVFQKKPIPAFLGALFAIPFTVTMLATSSIGMFAIVIPICMFAALGAVVIEVSKWAWVLLIPVLALLLWIAINLYPII
jgi:hypothetical protein